MRGPAAPAATATALIAALSAGNFVIGMGAFVVIGILSPLTESLAIAPADAGLVLTVYAIAYALGSPFGVALTGALDRRLVLLAGLGLFGVSALLSALATSLELLLFARVLGAFGAGLFTPVAAGVALAVAAPGHEGKALAQVFFGLTLAQVAGVPIGSWLGYAYGWQTAFTLVTVLAVIAWLTLARVVPRDLAFQVNRFAALGAALRDVPGLVSVLFTASFLGAIYIVFTYMALLLEQRLGLGRTGVTVVLVLYGIGAVAGNLLGGRLNDRIGPARTLGVLCIVQTLCLPVYALLPLPMVVFLVVTLLWSTFGWAFMAPQQTRLVRQRPERSNVMLSLNAAAIYVGAALGSWAGARVLERFDLDALGWAAALAMLFALGHLVLSERLAGREAGRVASSAGRA